MPVRRNDRCPCGSGKKYKKCCGAVELSGAAEAEKQSAANMDYFAMNQAIAYKGKTGQERENFCREYIVRKQATLKRIEDDQTEQTAARGEKISCHKGCSTCCTQYIVGSLQECEAIVYYLYQHPAALNGFLRAYPLWRAKIRENEAVFKHIGEVLARQCAQGLTEENRQAYSDANTLLSILNIPCPFLSGGACSIHEVRPWNCAKPVVTSPSEWCHPSTNLKNDKPEVYVSNIVPEEMPFYRKTKSLNMLLVHLGVYEILSGGYAWLSGISGLEGLEEEALNDPEVQATLSQSL